jgi:hypothetical protein
MASEGAFDGVKFNSRCVTRVSGSNGRRVGVSLQAILVLWALEDVHRL